jgi:hypothetical protein
MNGCPACRDFGKRKGTKGGEGPSVVEQVQVGLQEGWYGLEAGHISSYKNRKTIE